MKGYAKPILEVKDIVRAGSDMSQSVEPRMNADSR
jgi:hypothetical protein